MVPGLAVFVAVAIWGWHVGDTEGFPVSLGCKSQCWQWRVETHEDEDDSCGNAALV